MRQRRDMNNLAPIPAIAGESENRIIRSFTHMASVIIDRFCEKTETPPVNDSSEI